MKAMLTLDQVSLDLWQQSEFIRATFLVITILLTD